MLTCAKTANTFSRVITDEERSRIAVAVSLENRKPRRATILKPRKILAVIDLIIRLWSKGILTITLV